MDLRRLQLRGFIDEKSYLEFIENCKDEDLKKELEAYVGSKSEKATLTDEEKEAKKLADKEAKAKAKAEKEAKTKK